MSRSPAVNISFSRVAAHYRLRDSENPNAFPVLRADLTRAEVAKVMKAFLKFNPRHADSRTASLSDVVNSVYSSVMAMNDNAVTRRFVFNFPAFLSTDCAVPASDCAFKSVNRELALAFSGQVRTRYWQDNDAVVQAFADHVIGDSNPETAKDVTLSYVRKQVLASPEEAKGATHVYDVVTKRVVNMVTKDSPYLNWSETISRFSNISTPVPDIDFLGVETSSVFGFLKGAIFHLNHEHIQRIGMGHGQFCGLELERADSARTVFMHYFKPLLENCIRDVIGRYPIALGML